MNDNVPTPIPMNFMILYHYSYVMMGAMAFWITGVSIVYPTVWSKKTPKLRVPVLCEGNPPLTGEFPAQRASNAENASIWWRHHVMIYALKIVKTYADYNFESLWSLVTHMCIPSSISRLVLFTAQCFIFPVYQESAMGCSQVLIIGMTLSPNLRR